MVGYDPVTLLVNAYTDVAASSWYYEAVAFGSYHGLYGGYGNGIFAPQDSMTRAMFVQVLANLNEQIENGEWRIENEDEGHDGNSQFTMHNAQFIDVPEGAWYYDAVTWAAESGIVSGVGDGRFGPDRAISRQEIAVMLSNYANFKGYAIPVYREMPNFTDQDSIASWALAASSALAEAGVINGSNNHFYPQENATRAEVAQMFKNFLRFVV